MNGPLPVRTAVTQLSCWMAGNCKGILLISKCFFVETWGRWTGGIGADRRRKEKRRGKPVSTRSLRRFFAGLFAAPFAGQRLLHALLFTRLQVIRVPLYLFDDVFRLHLAFEAAERIFQRLAFLHSNFSQSKTPPNLSW